MQKWEYAELEITIGGPITGIKAELTIFKLEGKHQEQTGKYGDLIAKMGADGWEMITSSARIESGLTNKHKIHHMFKRLIEP